MRSRSVLVISAVVSLLLFAVAACVPTSSPTIALSATKHCRPSNPHCTTTTTAAPTTTMAMTTTTGATTTTTTPPGVAFKETFDDPNAFFTRFQIQVYHCCDSPPSPLTYQGDHDLACEGPMTYRTIHPVNPSEQTWWCAPGGPGTGHIMTAMNTTSFGHVSFSPLPVFSHVHKVCWDQSAAELGGRKWTTMIVVSDATFKANGSQLNYVDPIFQDPVPLRGIPLAGDTFMLEVQRGDNLVFVGQNNTASDFRGQTTFDKMPRFPICVTDNENGTITSVMAEPDGTTLTRTLAGAMPNEASRVIFQDVAYDPDKEVRTKVENPYTVHWDNIVVETS